MQCENIFRKSDAHFTFMALEGRSCEKREILRENVNIMGLKYQQ